MRILLATVVVALTVPTVVAQNDAPAWYNETHDDDMAAHEDTQDIVSDESEETQDTVIAVGNDVIAALRTNFSALEGSLSGIATNDTARFNAVLLLLTTIASELQNTSSKVNASYDKIVAVENAAATLGSRVDSVEFKVTNVSETTQRLEVRFGETANRIEASANRLDQSSSIVYALSVDLAALRNETYADHWALNQGMEANARIGLALLNASAELGKNQQAILSNVTIVGADFQAASTTLAQNLGGTQTAMTDSLVAFKRTIIIGMVFGVLAIAGVAFAFYKFMPRPQAYAAPQDWEPAPEAEGDVAPEPPARLASSKPAPEPEPFEDGEHEVERPPAPARRMSDSDLPKPREKPSMLDKLRGRGLSEEEKMAERMAKQYEVDPRSIKECYGTVPNKDKCFSEAGGRPCPFLKDCGPINGVDPKSISPPISAAEMKHRAKAEAEQKRAASAKAQVSSKRREQTRALPKSMEVDVDVEA